MYRTFTAFTLALAAAFGVSPAQATPLPPDQIVWHYDWEPGAAAVYSDNAPTGAVTFTNENPTQATGSSDIVATNLRVASTLPASSPNVITTSGAYTLSLDLSMTENSVLYQGSHIFSGKLSNTFSSESANVKNAFGAGSASLHVFNLGSYLFTVTLDAYTPPGPPSQFNTGSISAHVEVTLDDDTGVITETPEPGTMALAGLAVTCLGGVAWRKRRQKAG